MTRFNYHADRLSDVENDIVLGFSELVDDYRAGKAGSKEYAEKNSVLVENIGKYCVEMTGREWTGIEQLRNPQISTYDARFTNAFATILAEAITPVVPSVTSSEYATLWEATQVGFGDAAKYEVESNELFIVYDIAEGIDRANQQTAFNTEYTVQAHKKTISTFINWYHAASGKLDMGKFGLKVAKSFEAYIQSAVVRALTNAISVTGNPAKLGIAGYVKAGATAANWISLAQTVSAANGGAPVYALGTLGGLSKVAPTDAGFRFGPNDDLVTVGYLPSYKQVPMIELDQAIMPSTINGDTPTLVIPDRYIYFVPMGMNKPVKVVFEGENVVVTTDPLKTKDNTLGLTISMYIGVDVIVGSKFGVLDVG